MAKSSIASAYVQIIPTTEGLKSSLGDALKPEADKAGKTAGKGISSAMGTALKAGGAAVAAFGAAATAASAAVIGGVKDVAAYGDQVDKMSQKLGLSAESYQEWGYVMNIAGTDINSMQTGLKTLTNQLDEAKNGNDAAIERFEKLGISLEDIGSLSREDLFARTIEGFQGMADTTERAALANDLFGKSGQNLTPLFNTSAEATKEMIATANEYGMVMSQDSVKASAAFVDSMTTLQGTMTGVKNGILGQFLPAVTQITDGLAQVFSGDATAGMEQVKAGIDGFIAKFSDILPSVIEIGGQILMALAGAIIENLPQLMDSAVDIILELVNALVANLPMLVQVATEILLALTQGIAANLPELIPAMVEATLTIVQALIDNLPLIIDAAGQLIVGLVQGLINSLPLIKTGGKQIIDTLKNQIGSMIGQFLTKGREIVNKIKTGIINALGSVKAAGSQIISNVGAGIMGALGAAAGWGRSVLSQVVGGLRSAIGTVTSIGGDIVRGIWQGMSNSLSWIRNMIRGWVGNVKDFLKMLFGIGSPSKWAADEIGHWLPPGIAVGVEANADALTNAMSNLRRDALAGFDVGANFSYMNNIQPVAQPAGGSQISVVIYARDGMSVNDLYNTFERRLTQAVERKEAAFA